MVFKLKNTDLPSTTTVNNSTVRGLELTELGSYEVRSPLFSYQPLANYGISNKGSIGAVNPGAESGQIPIVDKDIVLEHQNVFYLYIIDNLWNVLDYDKVLSVNSLAVNKYVHFNNKTYILASTDETELDLTASFYSYTPLPDSTFTYSLDISAFDIESVSKVFVEGLEFKTTGLLTFVYDSATEILLLNACSYCRPSDGSLVEIVAERTLQLSQLSKLRVYEFDISEVDVSVVTYLEYKGKNYSISNDLISGSLFNNYLAKKVFTLD